MKLVMISDTHGMYDRVNIPDGDVLIHAGDITAYGKLEELVHFNNWLGDLPHKHKIVIAGNHDWVFQNRNMAARMALTNATYLQDEEITIDGLKFYGSPWQPEFCNWAFNLPRGAALKRVWDRIPVDTDVLITHGPPFEVLDLTNQMMRVGCEELAKVVKKIKPKLHVFGHIHYSYGIIEREGTIYVNAATCGEDYKPDHPPLVVDL